MQSRAHLLSRPAPNSMEAYANTPKEVLETIDYLEQLKHQVVQPANDDNECSICLEPFSTSGQGQRSQTADVGETPVSLPCGHVFGFTCIERYLSPFGEARNSWYVASVDSALAVFLHR